MLGRGRGDGGRGGRGGGRGDGGRGGGRGGRGGFRDEGPPDQIVGKILFTIGMDAVQMLQQGSLREIYNGPQLTISLSSKYTEAGNVLHECESELVCKWSVENKVPYFNAGVYLENKRKIGKIDEILGKISEVFFTVKMDPGVVAKSFQKDDVVYIGTDKLLPLARFTNPPKESGGRGGRTGRGDGRGGGRYVIFCLTFAKSY